MSSKFYCTIKDGQLDFGSRTEELTDWLSDKEGKRIALTVVNQTRSSAQNNSIHLYLEQRARELDEKGHTMQDVLRAIRKAEIRVTMEALKEIVWKGLQWIMFKKKSTTKLTKDEVDKVYEVCEKFFQAEFPDTGYIPFPSKEIQDYEQYVKNIQALKDF
jgi:hypothetical protein